MRAFGHHKWDTSIVSSQQSHPKGSVENKRGTIVHRTIHGACLRNERDVSSYIKPSIYTEGVCEISNATLKDNTIQEKTKLKNI